MTDDELLRYSKHIMLPQVGIEGQSRLRGSTVVMVGVGGLGSVSSMYLVASGVGKLILIDDDVVELSNLQRQIIYTVKDIGEDKVVAAKKRLSEINPEVEIEVINERLDADGLKMVFQNSNLVLDGTDNIETRFMVNKACVDAEVVLVSGSVVKMEGQIGVFKGYADGCCYQCVYGGVKDELRCVDNGVLSPMVGLVGSMQALQAVKILAETGNVSYGTVVMIDGNGLNFNNIKASKNPDCPACS